MSQVAQLLLDLFESVADFGCLEILSCGTPGLAGLLYGRVGPASAAPSAGCSLVVVAGWSGPCQRPSAGCPSLLPCLQHFVRGLKRLFVKHRLVERVVFATTGSAPGALSNSVFNEVAGAESNTADDQQQQASARPVRKTLLEQVSKRPTAQPAVLPGISTQMQPCPRPAP